MAADTAADMLSEADMAAATPPMAAATSHGGHAFHRGFHGFRGGGFGFYGGPLYAYSGTSCWRWIPGAYGAVRVWVC